MKNPYVLLLLQGLLWPLSLWYITFGNPGVPRHANKIGWVWIILADWVVAGFPDKWTGHAGLHVNSLHLKGIMSSKQFLIHFICIVILWMHYKYRQISALSGFDSLSILLLPSNKGLSQFVNSREFIVPNTHLICFRWALCGFLKSDIKNVVLQMGKVEIW